MNKYYSYINILYLICMDSLYTGTECIKLLYMYTALVHSVEYTWKTFLLKNDLQLSQETQS